MEYQLQLRSQSLVNENGFRVWKANEAAQAYRPEELAIVVVDMWNQHWCAGANHRVAPMLPVMDATLRRARSNGVLIVHAPSDCMPFYSNHPARLRALEVPATPVPTVNNDLPSYNPPLDASDHGSDTMEDVAPPNTGVWHRQHEAIWIDEACDLISDNGDEVYTNLKTRGIKRVLYMGVHTNMCIMCRPFAIIAMRKAGFETALVRDLTDPMYNPAMKPYVSHEEGRQLMIGYIEKFWCPTITSEQL